MIRRVKAADVQTSKPMDVKTMASKITEMAESMIEVEGLTKRVEQLEQDHKYTWKAIESLQKVAQELGKTAKALQQYTKDHDKLHLNMSQATGESQKDLMKLVRNVVAQTDIVQMAVDKFIKQKQEINVKLDAPAVNVEVPEVSERPVEVVIERGAWKAKLNRDNRGITQDIDLIPK